MVVAFVGKDARRVFLMPKAMPMKGLRRNNDS
jgi:hypothetical protein